MLTLQTIKQDPEFVIRRLAVKGFDGRAVITEILEIDSERRRLQQRCDSDASELKKLAASIGALMKKGEKEEAEKAKTRVAELKGAAKGLQDRLEECESKMRDLLLTVPNLPCDAVRQDEHNAHEAPFHQVAASSCHKLSNLFFQAYW